MLLDELKGYGERVRDSQLHGPGLLQDDGVVSCMEGEENYFKVCPRRSWWPRGAQERLIPFPNNDLPGVYGARRCRL